MDRDGDLVSQRISIAGTSTNCAGGRTLFANRQTPGVTFAITGPWRHIHR